MNFKEWWRSGTPWLWLNAGAVAISVIMVVGLLVLIAYRGLGHFWPSQVQQISVAQQDGSIKVLAGLIQERESVPRGQVNNDKLLSTVNDKIITRSLVKVGNRDVFGKDFQWVWDPFIKEVKFPEDMYVIERYEWGTFIGYLSSISKDGVVVTAGADRHEQFKKVVREANAIHDQIKSVEHSEIGVVNYEIERLNMKKKRLVLDGQEDSEAFQQIESRIQSLTATFLTIEEKLSALRSELDSYHANMLTADGTEVSLPVSTIVAALQPNLMSFPEKLGVYFYNFKEFIVGYPREANTEGGVFPAIFGTVTMVLIMSVLVTPFGVIAAVYLREYAKQGKLTGTIRIAVNNLAGVPSIVYGVFGLGFFVYFVGGGIDKMFYPEAAPAPVFGTPGLMWASITLALLTVPVVIVATEEGLARIPKSVREGSLALGATKFETLWKVVLPMASPAMMTGLILAVARAAGEVAPLMLVGVVKLAPTLPIDANFPFIHLERKFMHLGFHIYDVGFQSPNVDAARPLVYATAFLLVGVISTLNLTAIYIRNRLRERYKALET